MRVDLGYATQVSIHAPAGGATWSERMTKSMDTCFNPRPRRGGDRTGLWRFSLLQVSIHAPAGGATSDDGFATAATTVFQSTPPQGGRPERGRMVQITTLFQSTPPQGGRLGSSVMVLRSLSCFNPRPRRGGDVLGGIISGCVGAFQSTPPQGGRRDTDAHTIPGYVVSIHAPAGGATCRVVGVLARDGVSIHAPAGGATLPPRPRLSIIIVSIHAPAGGATAADRLHHSARGCFNPRPRRGGDMVAAVRELICDGFQSTPPQGGRHGWNVHRVYQ